MPGETLNGGLVTARDPNLLREGELAAADEAMYRPNSPAPEPAPDRKRFTLAPVVNLVGIRFWQREASTDLLVAHIGDTYQYATISESTQAFATISKTTTGGTVIQRAAGTRFDAAQLGDKIALVNGRTPILVKDPTTAVGVGNCRLGFDKPTGLITSVLSGAGAGGLWGATGFYWWWYTEVNTVLGIESPAADRITVNVDDVTKIVTLTMPTGYTNPEMNKRKLYRSLKQSASTDPDPFPVGYLMPPAFSAGTVLDYGVANYSTEFPALVLNLNGVEVTLEEAAGTAPNPTTIEVYENSLVCNDVDNPTHVRYTPPDKPGTWPAAYFVNIETLQQDAVIKIRRLGRVIVVLQRGQVIRLNYLPRNSDAEFARGRVYDILNSSTGVAGPEAACFVSLGGEAPALAFFGTDGVLYTTDGFSVEPLDLDVDWDTLCNDFSTVVLRDFARLKILAVYYKPKGSGGNTRAVYYHYHKSQRKDGGLKATGPITVSAKDAVYCPSKNLAEHTLFTAAADGIISLENRGPAPLPMRLKTRKFRGELPTDRLAVDRVFLRHELAAREGSCRFISEAPGELEDNLPLTQVPMVDTRLTMVEVGRELQNFQFELTSYAPVHFWMTE